MILRLSQTFYGYICSTLFAPSCGGILKLVCLLSIPRHTRLGADSLPFSFPSVAVKLTFMSLSGLQIWAGFLCMPSSCLPKLALATVIGTAHREPATGWGCRWGMQSAGGAMNQLGEFVGEAYLAAHRQLLDGVCDMVNKVHILSMPSKSPICCSPSLFPAPQSHRPWFSALEVVGEKQASLAAFCTGGEARHSLYTLTFPCRRNHGQGRSLLTLSCATLGKGWCG